MLNPEWGWLLEIPSGPALYPNYWTDVHIIFCPSVAAYGYDEFFSDESDLIDCETLVSGDTCLTSPCPKGRWCGGGQQQSEWDQYGWDTRVQGDTGWGQLDPRRFHPYTGYWYTGWAGGEDVDTWFTFGEFRNFWIWEISDGYSDPASLERDCDLGGWDAWDGDNTDRMDQIHQTAPNFVFPAVPLGNGRVPEGTIYRLREGIERFLITDINNPAGSAMGQSEVLVMWDITMMDYGEAITNAHFPGGANGLYMDGHVAWIQYSVDSREIPCTPANTFEYF
jgi:prepilin-type processing-associated H-X9-DG protein